MEQLSDTISESAVLSAVINNGADCFLDLSQFVSCDTFTDEQYAALWKCLAEIFKGETKKTDIPSILVTAKDLGLGIFFDSETKQKTLKRIANFPIESSNALSFAKKLKRLEIARNLVASLDKARKDLLTVNGNESVNEIIAKAEKPIFETINLVSAINQNEQFQNVGDGVDELIEHIENNPNTTIGIPSGFDEWDNAIGDALTPGVHVIGARAKGAKSFTVNNMGFNIADKGIDVLVMDTEMPKMKHQFRLLSLISGVPSKDIRRGNYVNNRTQVRAIEAARQKLKTLPYQFILTSSMSIEEMISCMRRWVLKKVGYGDNGKIKPCVIFFDYLRITDPKEMTDIKEYQALGLQMNALHAFALQYEVPIVALVQLNRDGISSEVTSAVAGSDRILHSCTSLTFLKWKSSEEIGKDGPELGNKKMVVVASRDGEGSSGEGDYIHIGTKLSISKMWECGSTRRPKKINQKFDIEQVDSNIQF